jgi:hypothetical protein
MCKLANGVISLITINSLESMEQGTKERLHKKYFQVRFFEWLFKPRTMFGFTRLKKIKKPRKFYKK